MSKMPVVKPVSSTENTLFSGVLGVCLRKFQLFLSNHVRNAYVWFLMVVGLAALCLNLLDAFTLNDDLPYRFIWQRDESLPVQPIQTISDVFTSQWVHYQVINGRWVSHTLAQFFLVFTPPAVYQAISAVMFVLLLHFSVRLSVRKEHRLFAVVTMSFLLFVVFCGIRTSLLWSMGMFNYVWATTATMAFLLFLRRLGNAVKLSHWLTAPLLLLVGCSHEALSLPLSIVFIVYIIAHWREIRRKPALIYILWYIVGMVSCLLSPGVWSRAGESISLFSRLLTGAVNLFFNLRVAWLLFFTLVFILKKDRAEFVKELKQHRYGYLWWILSIGIVLLCGTNLERVGFFADFISMLLLVRLWTNILSGKLTKCLIMVFSMVMAVCFVFAWIVRKENFDHCEAMKCQMADPERELIAVEEPVRRQSKWLDLMRDKYVIPSAEFGFFCCYMGFNAEDISMRQVAALYKKKKMVFLPATVVNKINEDSTAYSHYELDTNQKLYIWRLPSGLSVSKLTFVLEPENLSSLHLYQRLFTYKGDEYELDTFNFSVVSVNHHPYLVFTRPTTNIFRRIKDVKIE